MPRMKTRRVKEPRRSERRRPALVALAVLIGAVGLGLAVLPASKVVEPEGAAESLAGAQVFRDPATGQLREPEHDERGALVSPAGPISFAASPALLSFDTPDGGVAVRLGPEHMSYAVATKGADGKIALSHSTSPTPPPAEEREDEKQ